FAVANNLEVICEVHHESEMENVLELNPRLNDVNNRDLNTCNVDLTTTARVAESAINSDVILIGVSGMKDQSYEETHDKAGAEAILIVETLMSADNVPQKAQEMLIPLSKKAATRL